MSLVESPTYRRDVDGLRALAVVAVIAFHLGWLPFGYLGVDVFFVISGYLITWILHKEMEKGCFSIKGFYMRRVRRILPLSALIVLSSLGVGLMVMLPDDLENLAQSAIATNFFANNVLQAVTTKDYWDVVNEYKPLMHTWSLGVEEQYYFLYPFLFTVLGGALRKWLLPSLTLLAVLSLGPFLYPFAEHWRFYLLPFRFFELAAGGIAALALRGRLIASSWSWLWSVALVAVVGGGALFLGERGGLIMTVFLSVGVVVSANSSAILTRTVLENPAVVGIGLASFSLYMWHQPVLAFFRYFVAHEISPGSAAGLILLTGGLSWLSYRFVEIPFRNRSFMCFRTVLMALAVSFLISGGVAGYCFMNAGVIRDVPELELERGKGERGVHARYNARVYDLDRGFASSDSSESSERKLRVLVLGNSFARDWANVLLESEYAERLEVSYIYDPVHHPELKGRAEDADFIFLSNATAEFVEIVGLPREKVHVVGTKNFGVSNGIFYNRKGGGYFKQRTEMEEGHLERNTALRDAWGSRYIDLIAAVIDAEDKVPVFTPDGKFISQDTRHLTRPGARYFAELLQPRIRQIFGTR